MDYGRLLLKVEESRSQNVMIREFEKSKIVVPIVG